MDLVKFAFQHANPGDLFIQKADASTIGDLAKAVQRLFGDTGTKIIGTRHGEKLYETLMTREERLRSEDMGGYYRVAADSRDLNYDKFVVDRAGPYHGGGVLHQPQYHASGRGRNDKKDPQHRLCAAGAEGSRCGGAVRKGRKSGGSEQKKGGKRNPMNILITGSGGFVENLTESLKNIRDGKDRTRNLNIGEILEYHHDMSSAVLAEYCGRADFVFHLAGVNRPESPEEFQEGNAGFTEKLLNTLKEQNNPCLVLLSSSIQATGIGRYGKSDYGRSKRAGEKLVFQYGKETGAPVLVYRFPNLFGKWCRPNYNSVIATFCHNIARNLPITVSDPSAELELLYIDDLVSAMLDTLEGKVHRCDYEGLTPIEQEDGPYCYVPVTHKVTLGEIEYLLRLFHSQPETLLMPEIPEGSFAKKTLFHLPFLPAKGGGAVPSEDE